MNNPAPERDTRGSATWAAPLRQQRPLRSVLTRLRRSEVGDAMVEAVIAMAVIALTVTAFAMAALNTNKAERRADGENIAAQAAQATLQQLKTWPWADLGFKTSMSGYRATLPYGTRTVSTVSRTTGGPNADTVTPKMTVTLRGASVTETVDIAWLNGTAPSTPNAPGSKIIQVKASYTPPGTNIAQTATYHIIRTAKINEVVPSGAASAIPVARATIPVFGQVAPTCFNASAAAGYINWTAPYGDINGDGVNDWVPAAVGAYKIKFGSGPVTSISNPSATSYAVPTGVPYGTPVTLTATGSYPTGGGSGATATTTIPTCSTVTTQAIACPTVNAYATTAYNLHLSWGVSGGATGYALYLSGGGTTIWSQGQSNTNLWNGTYANTYDWVYAVPNNTYSSFMRVTAPGQSLDCPFPTVTMPDATNMVANGGTLYAGQYIHPTGDSSLIVVMTTDSHLALYRNGTVIWCECAGTNIMGGHFAQEGACSVVRDASQNLLWYWCVTAANPSMSGFVVWNNAYNGQPGELGVIDNYTGYSHYHVWQAGYGEITA